MIELTARERETVFQILRKHPDAGSDVDVEGFLKEKPLASHFFAMAARGQMKDRRGATDGYLRANTTKKRHWQRLVKGKQWDAARRVALHITNPE